MKSIGAKLTMAVVAAGFAVMILLVIITSVYASNSLLSESLDNMLEKTLRSTDRVDAWLNEQMVYFAVVARDLEDNHDITDEELREMCKTHLEYKPEYFDVYVGRPDGTAVFASDWVPDKGWIPYNRDWYTDAAANPGKSRITKPYVDAMTGNVCVSVSHAIYTDGALMGVVSNDMFVTVLDDIIEAARVGSGEAFIIDDMGNILLHSDSRYEPDKEGTFQNLGIVDKGTFSPLLSMSAGDDPIKLRTPDGKYSFFAGAPVKATGWRFYTSIPSSVIYAPVYKQIFVAIAVLVPSLVLMSFAIYFTINKIITKPIKPLTEFMNKASFNGDVSLTPEDEQMFAKFADRKDEIGQLMSAASGFINRIEFVGEALHDIADGDLTARISSLSEKDTMGNALRSMTDTLNATLARINQNSDQVSDSAKQVADVAQTLAQGSTEQASSISELSGTISEIATKAKENAEMSEKATELAEIIKSSAEEGDHRMDDMLAAMNEINEASQSISKVMKTIDDIAFQTKILSLNAAVEAARAGQAGRGFAVVAEEVRNLAQKSAEAAKDTSEMIQNAINKAQMGTRIVSETHESLLKIISGIKDSERVIKVIAKYSEEQSESVQRVNVGIEQLASVVQQNSATAEESAAASEEMSGLSEELQDLIARFKLRGEDTSFDAAGESARGSKSGKDRESSRVRKINYINMDDDDDGGKYETRFPKAS